MALVYCSMACMGAGACCCFSLVDRGYCSKLAVKENSVTGTVYGTTTVTTIVPKFIANFIEQCAEDGLTGAGSVHRSQSVTANNEVARWVRGNLVKFAEAFEYGYKVDSTGYYYVHLNTDDQDICLELCDSGRVDTYPKSVLLKTSKNCEYVQFMFTQEDIYKINRSSKLGLCIFHNNLEEVTYRDLPKNPSSIVNEVTK